MKNQFVVGHSAVAQWVVVVSAFSVALLAALGIPANQPPASQDPVQTQVQDTDAKGAINTNTFMERKLNSARDIVSGLASENYELIAKSGQDLKLLSQESQWEVFQTPEYLAMSNDFRESSGRLRDVANEKNLDGATLAYFEVMLSCVRCHKYIRRNPLGDEK